MIHEILKGPKRTINNVDFKVLYTWRLYKVKQIFVRARIIRQGKKTSRLMKLQEITGELINLQEITGDILKIQEFTGVYRITGLGGL